MTIDPAFGDAAFEDVRAEPPSEGELILDLEGYEGPIDVLLQLAREQKVDLIHISILALADQYLAFVQRGRHLRLELAADYLVMAAWLAYLKSRLLLPEPSGDEEPSAVEMAAALRFQLQRLQAVRDAGARLMARPQLGRDVFPRGAREPVQVEKKVVYDVMLYDLLAAYGHHRTRAQVQHLRIVRMDLYSVDEAVQRITRILGEVPGWRSIISFLPPDLTESLRRSATASTFAASLELCRQGKLQIRQDGCFSPIYLRSTLTRV